MKRGLYFILFLGTLLMFSCGKKETKKKDANPKEEVKDTIKDVEKDQKEEVSELIFKVQIGAYRNQPQKLASVPNVKVTVEESLYKYRLGDFKGYQEARDYRKSLLKRYPDAFIQALKNNQPIHIAEALK